MGEFLEKISEERKLRRFALALARTVVNETKHQELIDAVDAAEDFMNGTITEAQLATFHAEAERVLENIEQRELDLPDKITDSEMEWERAAVAVWTALPPKFENTSIEAARQSALHAAHYCRLIRGDEDLQKQAEVLVSVGLPASAQFRHLPGDSTKPNACENE